MGRLKRKAVSQPAPVEHIPIYTQESRNIIPSTPMSFEAIGNYENYFRHSNVHTERSLDYSAVSERFKELIKHYSWAKLVAQKPKKYNLTRIREFYAAISGCDSDKNITEVTFRGVTIPFEPKDINRILECLDVNENELYLAKWNIENKLNLKAKALECQQLLCPNGKTEKNSFTIGRADKDVRDLKHLISHNILPTFKINVFYYKEACLALAIWTREPVDIGRLIHKTSCDFAIKMRKGSIIPYPYLIDALCEDAEVPKLEGDENVEPHEIPLGTYTKDRTEISKEVESISRPAIPINVDIARSSTTNGMIQLKKDVEVLKGDVLLLNDNVVKLDANVTELKGMVRSFNDTVMRMTNNFMVSNDNMELFKATMIESVRQLNDNVIHGYNHFSTACVDLNKLIDDDQHVQTSRDIVKKWQPSTSTSNQAVPDNIPGLESSALDDLTIPCNVGTTDGESSKTGVGRKESQNKKETSSDKLSTLAKVAISFDKSN